MKSHFLFFVFVTADDGINYGYNYRDEVDRCGKSDQKCAAEVEKVNYEVDYKKSRVQCKGKCEWIKHHLFAQKCCDHRVKVRGNAENERQKHGKADHARVIKVTHP